MSEEKTPSRSGFTWRVFAIIIFAAFIVIPVNMWVDISIGGAGLSDFAVLMIAAELARLFGSPLTTQELATLLVGFGALKINYGISRIQSAYFSQSPLLIRYGLQGEIPYWTATLPESGFFTSRSIWHPILRGTWLRLDNMILPGLEAFGGLSLGIINKIIYVDQEKLPFPHVQIDAAFCSTVAEREQSRLRVFSVSLIIAFTYGVLVYIIPNLFNISLIPPLYVDLSPWIQTILPGACFGIATNLPTLLPGLFLPSTVILCQFIGCIAIWVFGNWYVVTHGLTEFSKIYVPGMSMRNIFLWAYQYVWMMPTIGLSMFVGFVGLRPSTLRQVASTLRKGMKSTKMEERVFSTWLFAIPLACVILSNLLHIWYRAPDYPFFPWLPASYSIVISLANSLLIDRAAGTGVNVDLPPNLDNIILVSLNYNGFNGWLVSPVRISPGFGGNVARHFKLAQLTKSSFTSFLAFFFIVGPISVVFALLFTQVLWSIAPIPSPAYPQSNIAWPRGVMNRAAWIARPSGIFKLDWIAYSALAGLALYVPLSLLRLPAATILISGLAGMGMLPSTAVNLLLGYFVRLVLERIVGKETYRNYRFSMVAGISAGTGVAALIGVNGLLIMKSIILWT